MAREWPVNKKAFSHHVLLGDEAPVSAIQTIGTVVSQGEIGVRFYPHARSGIAQIDHLVSRMIVGVSGISVLPRHHSLKGEGTR